MTANFTKNVALTIKQHRLLPPPEAKDTQPVLVALSGGADSVALLRVLLQLGYRCEAAHCNFHLRGEESDRDERFVAALCERLHVVLHKADFQTRVFAKERGISIEMAARELRYAFFREQLGARKLCAVAVAHHRDDNAETILLNIVRGTGLRGLAGMACKNGNIIRPLLNESREDIIRYLADIKQDYVTDSSNLEADIKRNIVRLRLMPLMRELNPAIVDTLLTNARTARNAQTYLQAQAALIPTQTDGDTITINSADIGAQILLFEKLRPFGLSPQQVESIWNNRQGDHNTAYHSATHNVVCDRGTIIIQRRQPSAEPESATLNAGESVCVLGQTITARTIPATDLSNIPTDPAVACIDAEKVSWPLTVRPAKKGDRFIPLGMAGSKPVSRYMIDRKFNAFQKQQQLVVAQNAMPTASTDDAAHPEQQIMWLVGQRIDERFKVVRGHTKQVLLLELH